MVSTKYVIADCNKHRCDLLRKKIGVFRSVRCIGRYTKERDLLECTWLEKPDVALIHIGDHDLNAFSALKRIKEITPEVKVVFYSDTADYAVDAYERGADYFLPLPADDITIGKMVLRYLES